MRHTLPKTTAAPVLVTAILAVTAAMLTWHTQGARPALAAPQTFAFVGSPQMYVVPEGVTSIDVTLNGAQGTTPAGGGAGGLGGRVQATISVTPGEVLQLMVGSQGGFNGGGQVAAAGGGATDIRRDTFSTASSCAYNLNCGLDKRIIVAGGGGAGGNGTGGGAGGIGGQTPTAGANGGGSTGGGPASAVAGGSAGTNAGGGATGATSAGGLGQGGQAGWKPAFAGGSGGGGYYGGGGGGADEAGPGSGGGGGTSWAGGTGVSAATFTDGVNTGNGSITISVASAIADATFGFTGASQTYTVPAGVTAIAVNIAGAIGGPGGDGDIVYGQLPVIPGQELQVIIGGAGVPSTETVGTGVVVGATGGYNGGGSAAGPWLGNRVGGGGASDIRVFPYGLADRVVVAAGGGGVGFNVGTGWFGGKGGFNTNGSGADGFRNSNEVIAGGGTLTAGGQVTNGVNDATTQGSFGQGGSALPCCPAGSDYSGGGGGYYGGAAGFGGGGGSSYASVTGPDATRQGVGNVLGAGTAAPFQHLRGGSFGDGYAVITSMAVTVTGGSAESSTTPGEWTIEGTINPKSLATTPFAFWGPSSAVIAAGGGTAVEFTGPGGASVLAGNTVQSVSGTITGVPDGTSYYRICARSVAGYSCGAVQSFGYLGPDDASLSSLSSSPGTLSPSFVSSTTAYAVSVPNATTSVALTFATGVTNATVAVSDNTTATVSGSTSPVTVSSLPVGTTTVTIEVTSEDGTTTTSYTVNITRAPAEGGGGGGGGSSTPEPTPAPTPTPSPTRSPAVPNLEPELPGVNPNIPAGGVPLGGSVFLVNGQPEPVTVRPDAPRDATGLQIEGDGWRMRLVGRTADDRPLGVTPDGALILEQDRTAFTEGSGFLPNSEVKLYVFSEPRFLGTVMTDASGTFRGSVPLPLDIKAGRHTLQSNGLATNGSVRSLSLGVLVQAPTTRAVTRKAQATVYFGALSAKLDASAKASLRALAAKRAKTTTRVVSIGFVQPSDTTRNDKSLSLQRAKAVAAYLKSIGVKGVVVTRGDGIAKETGAAGRKATVTLTYRR